MQLYSSLRFGSFATRFRKEAMNAGQSAGLNDASVWEGCCCKLDEHGSTTGAVLIDPLRCSCVLPCSRRWPSQTTLCLARSRPRRRLKRRKRPRLPRLRPLWRREKRLRPLRRRHRRHLPRRRGRRSDDVVVTALDVARSPVAVASERKLSGSVLQLGLFVKLGSGGSRGRVMG